MMTKCREPMTLTAALTGQVSYVSVLTFFIVLSVSNALRLSAYEIHRQTDHSMLSNDYAILLQHVFVENPFALQCNPESLSEDGCKCY
jgi:hypothetical protein